MFDTCSFSTPAPGSNTSTCFVGYSGNYSETDPTVPDPDPKLLVVGMLLYSPAFSCRMISRHNHQGKCYFQRESSELLIISPFKVMVSGQISLRLSKLRNRGGGTWRW
jgi:hypothetical protein